jgi:2'-5' RNA ligase
MHLTLMFLGSVPTEKIDALESALRGACAGSPPLTLIAEGIGAFPSVRSPRVIWTGLLGDVEPLQILQQRIHIATASFSQKVEDRPFHPHLTLGRVRENAKRHTRRIGEELQRVQQSSFGTWQANEVRLMRSQLSPKGSTYTILASLTLHSVVN